MLWVLVRNSFRCYIVLPIALDPIIKVKWIKVHPPLQPDELLPPSGDLVTAGPNDSDDDEMNHYANVKRKGWKFPPYGMLKQLYVENGSRYPYLIGMNIANFHVL